VVRADLDMASTIRPVPELVVIAEQLLAPVPGGTGRYTAELLRALVATAPPDWTVSSVVARHPGDLEDARVDGVEGPRTLALPSRALAVAWQFGLPLWPGGDAVHAPTPLAPPRAPHGRTLSVTVHDTVPWSHPETLTRRGASWHRTMVTRASRRADALVVPTKSVAHDLAGRIGGVAPIRVAGHGVAGAFRTPGGKPPGLPDRYVLAIGTLEPRKGVDVLIEAMSEVDDVPLVLAGQPGWGGLDPRALAREHGLVEDGLAEDRLRLLGRLSDAELAATLRGASVLAVPSLAEGFGLPVLEAMATGVPVVHSDAPALVEVAGGAGIAVPRRDANALATALREVLGSPDRASELAAAGEKRAAEFSWKRSAEAVWTIHLRR
jgi:glycosyltransferase involved in cell wall biosynthesis